MNKLNNNTRFNSDLFIKISINNKRATFYFLSPIFRDKVYYCCFNKKEIVCRIPLSGKSSIQYSQN